MDILHLVDRLEELFNQSKPIPLTHSVIVDEDRMLEIIDQMRISIPEEVKNAQQVLAQRDRVIAQAQEEANRTVKIAKEKGDEIISRDAIVDGAQARAEQIIAQARADAEALRMEADEYIIDSLAALEAELTRLLNQARNGIAKLNVEQQRFVETEMDEPSEIEDEPQPSEEI
jgi:cell division septum initiation protein DivIVA